MNKIITNAITKMFGVFGYAIVKTGNDIDYPIDFDEAVIDLINEVKPFTMTSNERMYGLVKAVEYIDNARLDGDVVECGVWKGGSSMAAAKTLLKNGTQHRKLWLYDTYEGMSEPTTHDCSIRGGDAIDKYKETQTGADQSDWCRSSLEDVKENIRKTGYPEKNVNYIKGKVEDTIPDSLPNKIALLRLDTDWYESTKHELEHLFPLLTDRGVLIIDDYGHWEGCRKAVDEYISDKGITILLNRLDYTGRIAIK